MITTLIAIFVICSIIVLTVLFFAETEYNSYVTALAYEYSFEEIEEKINEITVILEKGNFKGEMLENYLNDMDLWLMVRECKKEL